MQGSDGGRPLWVARLHVSEATRNKLRDLHGLDADKVRAKIECQRNLPYRWNQHPERGRRVLVDVFFGRRRVRVVLYPKRRNNPFGDEFHLGSAYPLGGPGRYH